jgi:hypothetical protein
VEAFFVWLATTSLSTWLLNTVWVWPALEILHFVGLTILVGSIFVVDLNMLGQTKFPYQGAIQSLVLLSILGFLTNFLTGALFFIADPLRYSANTGFQAKMILLLVLGINALLYFRWVAPREGDQEKSGTIKKVIGGVSLAGWLGVLLLGRLIPYIGSG